MIRIKVLYFGQAREAAGKGMEYISISSTGSVRAVVGEAMRLHGGLRTLESSLRIALNEEVAGDDESVGDGDTVAFLPPVAGG